ncbi:hypothetical protein PSEUDO8BK_30804 [Pseudomonas sp. 8BK]|nr:hypothetical protein PSEUDO8BK_30804 [Pseudomonas sp. 8BK]
MAEAQMLLSYLNNLGSALVIQYKRCFAKKMCKCSAIRAIADKTIVNTNAVDLPSNSTALTLNWMHKYHHSLAESQAISHY